MNLSDVRLSFEKEMTEVLRDKRALFITLALPALVFPIFELTFALMANNVADQTITRLTRVCFVGSPQQANQLSNKTSGARASRPHLEIATKNSAIDASNTENVRKDDLQILLQDFRSSPRIKVITPEAHATVETMILKDVCDVVVAIDPNFVEKLAACQPARINLFDSAYSAYMIDEQNVWDVIRKFADDKRASRLAPFKIPKETTKIVKVAVKTVESDGSRSAYWAGLIFTLLVMFVMSLSSMYPALDVVTGERERGTLILLLMAPGDRRSYICGKLLTVSCVTLLASILALISVTVSLPFFVMTVHDAAGAFRLSLPLANLLSSSLFLIPIAVGISATALLISSYARTFQQGQSYFAPLILFGVILCGLVISCEESAPFFINLIPIANLLLCMYRAIQGHWDALAIISSLLSSAVYLALLIRIAVGILDREESLFGIKQAPTQRTTFAKEAFVLFGICVAGFFYLMPFLQVAVPIWGLLIAQILVIGLPGLLAPKILKLPVAKTLSIVRPSLWSAGGALLLAPGVALASTYIAHLQSAIMPDAESYIKALQDFLIPKGSSAWAAYFTIALGPAICEELLFRGAIQGLLRKSFSKPLMCSIVAVLFGIMHGSSYRFLPTSIMGFFLAMLVEYTGSIFPAMILHASNNALAVYEASSGASEATATTITIAIILGIAGLFALRQGHKLQTKALSK